MIEIINAIVIIQYDLNSHISIIYLDSIIPNK